MTLEESTPRKLRILHDKTSMAGFEGDLEIYRTKSSKIHGAVIHFTSKKNGNRPLFVCVIQHVAIEF